MAGQRGPAGPIGPRGPQGAPGSRGFTGPQGPRGPEGSKGAQGLPGTPTRLNDILDVTLTAPSSGQVLKFNGTQWVNGTNSGGGGNGASAYDIALDNGFVGDEAAWLASLQGEPGADGAPGAPGQNGAPGADGQDGADGSSFIWQGPWDPSGSYIGGRDVVSYNGSSYIKIGDGNSGSSPSADAQRWSPVAIKGDAGADGAPGADGQDGAPGADGQDGAPGTNGNDGAPGQNGQDGASAYEIAVTNGFVGNEVAWLASLQGADGQDGTPGADGNDGAPGQAGAPGADGLPGADGQDGASAYELAVANGFVGSEPAWLASLQGADGQDGATGAQGVSVNLQGTKATIADLPLSGNAGDGWIVTTGNGSTHLDGSLWFWNVTDGAWNDIGPIVGPQGDPGEPGADGLPGANGNNGADGASAYEVAVANGFVGNEAAWLASLVGADGNDGTPGADGNDGAPGQDGAPGANGLPGADGQDGADGVGVPAGGSAGQVLAKIDGNDYNTEWVDQTGGTSLPADANGYLVNDGSGNLSWVAGNGGGITGQDPWQLLYTNASGDVESNLCLAVQEPKNEMHSIPGYGNVGMNVQVAGSNLIINPRLDDGNSGELRAVTGALYFTRPETDPAFSEAQNLKALNPTRRAAYIKYVGDNGGDEFTGALELSPWYQGQRGYGGASSITIDDDFSDRMTDRSLVIKRTRDYMTWGSVVPSGYLGTPGATNTFRTTTYDFNGANGHQAVNINGALSFAAISGEGGQYKSDVPEWSPGANRGHAYITIPALHTGSGLKWQGQISSNPARIRDTSGGTPYVDADGIPFWSLGYKMSTQNIEDYPSMGIAQYDRIPDNHAISWDVRGRVSVNEATLDESFNVLGSIKLQVSSATQNSHNGVVNLNWRPGRPQEGDEAQVGIYFADGTFQNTAATGVASITVQEEGTDAVTSTDTINFVGAGVTATNVDGVATVTIPGQTGQGTFSTLPGFLVFEPGTTVHTGQNSEGIFFTGPADGYPIRTNFPIGGTTKVVVTVDMVVNDECSDFGLCVFDEDSTPAWQWEGPDATRIAAQYNCENPEISTLNSYYNYSSWAIPGNGTYRVRFTYDPNTTPNLKLETLDMSDNVLSTLETDGTLDTTKEYYIGFGADQDNAALRTFINNLTIAVNGGNTYSDSLQLTSVAGNEIVNTDGNTNYSVSVGTDGVVTMVTARGGLEFGALPEPGGPTHFHIMRPMGENGSGGTDLYFGDDYNYVLQRPAAYGQNPAYGVEIGTNDNDGGNQNVWRFETDGNLTTPGHIFAQQGNDLHLRVFNPTVEGEPGGVTLSLQNRDVESGSKTTQFNIAPTEIVLTTDFSGNKNEWTFGTDGDLTLPAGGDIKDSNGASVLGGGSGASGFTKVAVLGQDDVLAEEAGNELALVAGDGIAITTDSSNGTVTISAASNTTPQYGYFTELVRTSSSNTVYGQAVVMDSDGNSYISYVYYDDNQDKDIGGMAKFDNTGEKVWAVTLASQNPDARYLEIVSLELVTIDGDPSLIAIGSYYNNNTSKDVAFIYYVNPMTGSVGEPLVDTELVTSSGMNVRDGVAGYDGSNTYAVVVGETYDQTVTKTFTPLAGSTTDKLYVSWADFNASGLSNSDQVYYNSNGTNYYVTMNGMEVSAIPAGSTDPSWAGISLTISATEAGNYIITRVNGWGYLVNGWSNPVTLTVPGSALGGVDSINDLTFDFSNVIFANNSSNIQAAVSNIQGTPVTGVYCFNSGGFDWGTQVGNALTFNYQLNNQAYIGRFGQSGSWTKNFGGGSYDRLNSVVVDSDLNTYAVGYVWNGSRSALVAKYDYEGGPVWAVYIDPSNNTGNALMSVDLLSDGNLITVDEDGVVTKLDKTDGSILWQVRADNDPNWDGDFRGTATPDGDYIITNYEDNDYTQYVMRVSGSDGSSVWNKRITRTYGGDDGEMQADDDAQYIDCNATHLVITGRTDPPNGDTTGIIYSFPITGDNVDGTYGQYVITSESMNWDTLSTTAVAATINNTNISVSLNSTGPTSSSSTVNASTTTTMGGEPIVEPTVITWTNPNDNVWRIEDYNGGAAVSYNGSNYDAKWFDINNHTSGSSSFRGAIIQYHAFIQNQGIIIGTIHLANDYTQQQATHTEHLSGNSDLQFVTLWDCNNERGQLYFKMTNGNSQDVMIQWTAKVFYGSENNC